MKLVDVYSCLDAPRVLFKLLEERTPEQSISHKRMPTIAQHMAFFCSKPYSLWYLIVVDGQYVGAIYETMAQEIGVHIFKEHRGNSYGPNAVRKYIDSGAWMTPRTRFLANVNPENEPSRKMFEKLGFKLLQLTYCFDQPSDKDRPSPETRTLASRHPPSGDSDDF